MKLQDYVSYYLGCKCKTYAGKGKLTSFDIDSGHWYVSLDTGGGTVGNINDTYRECPEESKQAFPDGYPPKSILKPILRKLSDITKEEEKELEAIKGTRVIYRSEPNIEIRYDTPETFHWMLKKQFDLFELLENGLAIYSKTQTT